MRSQKERKALQNQSSWRFCGLCKPFKYLGSCIYFEDLTNNFYINHQISTATPPPKSIINGMDRNPKITRRSTNHQQKSHHMIPPHPTLQWSDGRPHGQEEINWWVWDKTCNEQRQKMQPVAKSCTRQSFMAMQINKLKFQGPMSPSWPKQTKTSTKWLQTTATTTARGTQQKKQYLRREKKESSTPYPAPKE